MTKWGGIAIIFVVIAIVGAWAWSTYVNRPQPLPAQNATRPIASNGNQTAKTSGTDADCGTVPDPMVANDQDLNFKIDEIKASLESHTVPKILDALPQDARRQQIAAYIYCKASISGSIKTDEQREDFMFLATGPTAQQMKDYIENRRLVKQGIKPGLDLRDAKLGTIEEHFKATPASEIKFDLSLDTNSDKHIREFYLGSLSDDSWPAMFKKICTLFDGCLKCDPEAQQITERVRISTARPLIPIPGPKGIPSQGYTCAPKK
jgi:hypothetical protein